MKLYVENPNLFYLHTLTFEKNSNHLPFHSCKILGCSVKVRTDLDIESPVDLYILNLISFRDHWRCQKPPPNRFTKSCKGCL